MGKGPKGRRAVRSQAKQQSQLGSLRAKRSRGEGAWGSESPGSWGWGGAGWRGEVSEGDADTGGDSPAVAGDFDVLAVGIGEVEEDCFGDGEGAAGIDAVGDADVAGGGIAGGLGVEVMEDGVEGVAGGEGVGFGVAEVEEPLAEGAGEDGDGVKAEGVGGNGDEGASGGGEEGAGASGEAEESVEFFHD